MGDQPPDRDRDKKRFHGGHINGLHIIRLDPGQHIEVIRALFVEYAESLDFDLEFQNFREELVDLPGEYAPPAGCLLLALIGDAPAGCVGLRKLDDDVCEMKRLYVRPKYRAQGIGRVLAESVAREARNKGYGKMRLDTVPSMRAARKLYASMGFREVKPYRYNPIDGATFMEKKLG